MTVSRAKTTAEFAVQAATGLVENAMIRGVVPLDPGRGSRRSRAYRRRSGSPFWRHDAPGQGGPCLVGGRERRWPVSVDQGGVEVVHRPIGVEIAAREYRADQSRAQFRCGRIELIHIGVLGCAQNIERTAKPEVAGVVRPAVGRVEDQRHFCFCGSRRHSTPGSQSSYCQARSLRRKAPSAALMLRRRFFCEGSSDEFTHGLV